MKKLSPKQRERLIICQLARERHDEKRNKRNKTRRVAPIKISNHIVLPVVGDFSLYSDSEYSRSVKFIKNIQALLRKEKKILLDFNETENVTAAAMLRLHAEISSYQRYYGQNFVKFRTNNARSTVKFMLKNSGFLSEYDDPANIPSRDKILTMRTGTDARGHLKSITNTMNDCFYSGELSEQERSDLYQGINEAMLNVSQHAYDESEPDLANKIGKRWWIYAQQFDDQLYIAFCDRGVGIPATLPRHGSWENIKSLGKIVGLDDDAAMIQAAMEFGRSEAKTPGRGLGLQDVLKFANENPEGILWIFSRKGVYITEKGKTKPELRNYKESINGTLIQWQVSLAKRALA